MQHLKPCLDILTGPPRLPHASAFLMQYRNATDGKGDVDVVEAKLDDVVRQLIASVHSGATSLEKQVRMHMTLGHEHSLAAWATFC